MTVSQAILAPADELKTSQSAVSPIAAQSNASASALGIVSSQGGRSYGLTAATTYNSSVLESGANTATSSMDLEFVPWVQISKKLRMDLFVAVSKDLRNDEKYTLKNSNVALFNTPLEINKTLKYRAKIHALIPTDKEAREINSFRTGVNFANRLYIMPSGLPNLAMFYQLSLAKNFHRFQTTGLGESNQSNSIANSLYVGYEIGRFSLSVTPRITQRWTYQGTPSSRYDMSEEIGMNIQNNVSVAIGHTNDADFYKANGRDANFSVYDRDTSNYYLSANLTF